MVAISCKIGTSLYCAVVRHKGHFASLPGGDSYHCSMHGTQPITALHVEQAGAGNFAGVKRIEQLKIRARNAQICSSVHRLGEGELLSVGVGVAGISLGGLMLTSAKSPSSSLSRTSRFSCSKKFSASLTAYFSWSLAFFERLRLVLL